MSIQAYLLKNIGELMVRDQLGYFAAIVVSAFMNMFKQAVPSEKKKIKELC